jgi:hypothetical protein
VPDSYPDDRFDPVRTAMTPACKASARAYLRLIGDLTKNLGILNSGSSSDTWTKSAAYDRDCLTPLKDIPLGIQQVTGILITSGGVPFCSATAVGPKTVITAKHCFFNPTTGRANEQFGQLQANQVSFRALAKHNGISTFSVRAGKGAVAGSAFAPAADVVLLTVTDGPLAHFANLTPAAPSTTPVPTWVVGVNALVGDVRSAAPATSFVRGSSPNGCSVVQVPSSGCLVHTCQTAPATSGAGMLEDRANGPPLLLGVHVTSSLEATACGVAAPTSGSLNLAAAVTSAILNP